MTSITWQRGSTHAIQTQIHFSGWKDDAPPALMALKERIQPFEASGHWELLKKMVNPYEIVYTHDSVDFHPSIAVIKPLSRSYFKMIEMLDILGFYEGVPKQTQKIRTAHIAEGPGGFIQAVADTVERHNKTLSLATAMTLKPVDGRVPGWRRAATFLQRNRQVKLHYGADTTGDIYLQENQASFIKAVAPGAALFTADGGFDFSVNYQIQEQRVFHLLVCSALTGVQSLSIDGSLIIKLFDTYSDATKALVVLLSRHFKEWIIYKPCLSRPCNSERYFLGRGFRGLQRERLAALQALFDHSLREEYPTLTMAPEEAAYMAATTEESTTLQLRSLEKALYYASHLEDWYTNQLPKDFTTSLNWCYRYRIPTHRQFPAPISKPLTCVPFQEAAGPRSRTPDEGSAILDPFDQALPTLSAGFVYQSSAPGWPRIVVESLD